MEPIQALWVDDEIDLLKPHILFLEEKGYKIHTSRNGVDALEFIKNQYIDIVLLDENMPGMDGLEVLGHIKKDRPNLPVVMITKSEAENIMEDAIGAKISDYLIKPVNPNQILLSLKKNLDDQRLVSEKTTSTYQRTFQELNSEINAAQSLHDWSEVYQKLIFWELEMEQLTSDGVQDILLFQKTEANQQFTRNVRQQYQKWIHDSEHMVFSHRAFAELVVPHVDKDRPTLLLMIDNLRFDQWKIIQSALGPYYGLKAEKTYCSILPTATQYARNAFFAGMLPNEIKKTHPQWWKDDTDAGGKNLFEDKLLSAQLSRLGLNWKHSYHKINKPEQGVKLAEQLNNELHNQLTIVVYNFVDMISHAKTEMDVIKELANSDKAYRSLTSSWFANSPLLEIVKKAQSLGFQLMITTDHGTINVKNPVEVLGDRDTSTNIRYKTGRRVNVKDKNILVFDNPDSIGLPTVNMTSSFVFATEDRYLVYPTRYHHFVKFYKDTYQHGGVSLEEMLIPFAVLSPK
mgnify:CR=1 FL=1